MAEWLQPDRDLLLKVNKVADQSEDSANCGYFAAKFLIDRFNGDSFAKASGYNKQYPEGERAIESWKRHLSIEPFRAINRQSGEGFKDVVKAGVNFVKRGVQRVRDVLSGSRKHASPSVRKWLEKYGDMEVIAMKVCRKPIMSMIEKLANLLSLGKLDTNKEKLSYDKLMHLFLVVEMKDFKTFRVEKNHVVEITPTKWDQSEGTEEISLHNTTQFTIGDALKSAEQSVGEKLWIYDARNQNCQYFIKWLLQYTSMWTDRVEKFVMQDVEKVLEGMGLFGKAARAITDVAAVADVAMNGKGQD